MIDLKCNTCGQVFDKDLPEICYNCGTRLTYGPGPKGEPGPRGEDQSDGR